MHFTPLFREGVPWCLPNEKAPQLPWSTHRPKFSRQPLMLYKYGENTKLSNTFLTSSKLLYPSEVNFQTLFVAMSKHLKQFYTPPYTNSIILFPTLGKDGMWWNFLSKTRMVFNVHEVLKLPQFLGLDLQKSLLLNTQAYTLHEQQTCARFQN